MLIIIKKNKVMSQGFIVASNILSGYDARLDERFNYESGLSDVSFRLIVRDFIERKRLKLLLLDGDTVIFTADDKRFADFKTEIGNRFSFLFCDEYAVKDVIDAIFDSRIINKILGEAQLPRTDLKTYPAQYLDV